MIPPTLLASLLLSCSGAPMQQMAVYQALAPREKLRAQQVLRSLMADTPAPIAPSKRPSAAGLALHRRIQERARAARAAARPHSPAPLSLPSTGAAGVLETARNQITEAQPDPLPDRPVLPPPEPSASVLGPEAYGYRPLVASQDHPVVRVLRGRARRSLGSTGNWSRVPLGNGTTVPWGSWLDTNIDGQLEVLLPGDGGRFELAPRTKMLLIQTGGLLRRGEVRLQVPSHSRRWLKIKTDRGFLRVGPGGVARIRPQGFARVRGPVAALAPEGGDRTE